jgi:hypothetical protein
MAGLTLATKPEFVEMREDFYQWWSHIAASGMSAWDARDDMEKRIAEYQRLIKGQGWKTTARYAIKVADAFSGGLGLVSEAASVGAEAFLGTADILADERLKRENAPARLKVRDLPRCARQARLACAIVNRHTPPKPRTEV